MTRRDSTRLILSDENVSGCRFGALVRNQDEDSWQSIFAGKVVEKLLEISEGDEIGGVLPNNDEIFAQELLGSITDPRNAEAQLIVEAVVVCMRNRYMGLCALSNCRAQEDIAEFINETQQLLVNK